MLIFTGKSSSRMFFIGGLNSVLPCILYLALVWIFIIVGHANFVKDVLKQKDVHLMEIQAAEINQHEPDFLLINEQVVESSSHTQIRAVFHGPPGFVKPGLRLIKHCVLTHPPSIIHSFHISIFAYRGPPVA